MRGHLPHYLVLVAIFLVIFLSRLFFTLGDSLFLQILFMTAFIYAAWGIIHHWAEHDLSIKIVIEYILIAAVAMLISLIAIKGGI